MMDISLQDFVRILRKKWWIIALTAVLFACVSGYVSFYRLTPVYSNSSTLLVNEREQRNYSLTFDDVMLYEKLMGTYKDILMSKRILNPVSAQMGQAGHPMTPDDLSRQIKITTNPSSQVIRITVNDMDYKVATDIANLMAETFSTNLKTIMTINNVQILDSAELRPHPIPVKPNKELNVAIAFIMGIFISVTGVLFLHFIDTRVRSEEDLSGLIDYPLLGSIPSYKGKHSGRSLPLG